MKISEKCKLLREMFPDYKTTDDYQKTTDYLMDITMSCTPPEALDQLLNIMNSTFDVIIILAAYDLYESIYANMSKKYDI